MKKSSVPKSFRVPLTPAPAASSPAAPAAGPLVADPALQSRLLKLLPVPLPPPMRRSPTPLPSQYSRFTAQLGGYPAFLLFTADESGKRVYLFERVKRRVMSVDDAYSSADDFVYLDTLLSGEVYRGVFWAYDMLLHEGLSLASKSYQGRYEALCKLGESPGAALKGIRIKPLLERDAPLEASARGWEYRDPAAPGEAPVLFVQQHEAPPAAAPPPSKAPMPAPAAAVGVMRVTRTAYPDVYDVYDDASRHHGYAVVQTLRESEFLRSRVTPEARLECRLDPEFGRYRPVIPADGS